MEEPEEVFEDALEEVEEAKEGLCINNNNNNDSSSKSKSALKGFKLSRKGKKSREKSVEELEDIVSLEEGLLDAQRAIDLFFDNQFEESREVAQRHCDRSIYHALGNGTFHYLKAVMTFDQEHVEVASNVLSQSVATIDRFRRKTSGIADSLGKMVRKQDYDAYTELEIHAELVYAECLLLKAMLTVCEDETLTSFLKAGLKVRQCYISFKECWSILQHRDWSNDKHKSHFEGGVRLGVGTFNLLMSLLPPRITKLMEFVGFSGSREVGLKQLLTTYKDETCLRQFLASIVLLGYHLFLTNHMGQADSQADYTLVSQILTAKLKRHPRGAFFLFFQGRFQLVQGNCDEAARCYALANAAQSEWPQFHHVAAWELVWAASYRGLWREALKQASVLLEESRWSPCIYSYLKAAFYCMLQSELTSEEVADQAELFASVPKLKQRIAGKSLPMEKYACRKAERWHSQGGRLLVPGLELIYLWNGFSIIGRHYNLVESVYVAVQEAEESWKSESYSTENSSLLLLLRGVCLRYMGAPLGAEDCLRQVLANAPKLQVDGYLAPYATVELALILINSGQVEEAGVLLETAKTSYKDYSLQSRLHFRIHAAQNQLRELREKSASREIGLNRKCSGDRRGSEVLEELADCQTGEELVPHI